MRKWWTLWVRQLLIYRSIPSILVRGILQNTFEVFLTCELARVPSPVFSGSGTRLRWPFTTSSGIMVSSVATPLFYRSATVKVQESSFRSKYVCIVSDCRLELLCVESWNVGHFSFCNISYTSDNLNCVPSKWRFATSGVGPEVLRQGHLPVKGFLL
jgi:hypothetical protein